MQLNRQKVDIDIPPPVDELIVNDVGGVQPNGVAEGENIDLQ